MYEIPAFIFWVFMGVAFCAGMGTMLLFISPSDYPTDEF